MDEMEVRFEDLIPEAQKKVLEFYGITKPEDGNYDTLPLCYLYRDEEA